MKTDKVTLVAVLTCLLVALAAIQVPAQTNPVPSLNLPIFPLGAVPGAAQFNLIATGTGFVPGSTIVWNGTALQTSYVSSTRVNAVVPAAYVASPGSAVIAISQPGALPASNWVPFEIGNTEGAMTFGKTDYTASFDSFSLISADFNLDGILDLATVSNTQSTFSILIGNGDGTFKVQGSYAVPSTPGYAAVADFNNDGKPDLAISGQGTVYVFQGNGDGTFSGPTNYTMQANEGPIALGDFNGDGTPDVVTTDAATDTVAVMANGVATTYTVGSSPMGVQVGDFNRDGKLDIAVANWISANISILLGNGDGTFRTPFNVSTTDGPWALLAADVNNDAKLDLIVATPGYLHSQNLAVVLIGNGDGTFKAPVGYAVASDPVAVVAGDFNDDKKLDVAVAAETSNAVSLLLGNGDGTFQASRTYTATASTASLVAGDFNKDGYLDLAGSYGNSSATSVFLQAGTGKARASVSPTSLLFPLTVVSYNSASMPVTLTNTGTGNLSIKSITASTQFSQTNNCGTALAPGAFCTINVTFTPQHQGTQTGALTITDNAMNSPQTVSLQGQATFFLVSPLNIDFGTVSVGTTSSPHVISIYGEDGQPEKVTFSVSPSNETSLFPYTNTCTNGYVPSHATCTVSISFAPTAAGTLPPTTFQINGGGGLTKVTLMGTGQ